MTAKPTTAVIPSATIGAVLALLADVRRFTDLRCDADELAQALADALERDESAPDHPASIAGELLEAIGRASGRTLPTVATLHSLSQAREALAELTPVLGAAKVVELPRAVTRDVQRDIAAEVSRQLEQAAGVDVQVMCGVELIEAIRLAAAPRKGETVVTSCGRRFVVDDVEHDPRLSYVVLLCSPERL